MTVRPRAIPDDGPDRAKTRKYVFFAGAGDAIGTLLGLAVIILKPFPAYLILKTSEPLKSP